MADITPITTHSADAKARLPGYLRDSTNLNALVGIFADRTQTLEDELISILNFTTDITTAVGAQLDTIGEILNLPRLGGETDADYRIRLQGRSIALSRSGTPEAVIEIWDAAWDAVTVYLTEFQPAAFEVAAEVPTDPGDAGQDASAQSALQAGKAAGVGAIGTLVVTTPFLWGFLADVDGNGDQPALVNGFGTEADADGSGDIAPSTGGGNFGRVV
jgi:hypothetical protein